MLYVFLSICCSVIVYVLLKLAKRYQIDVFQAITWSYSIAVILIWIFLKPNFQNLPSAPFHIYVLLGLLLPSLFMVLAVSVRITGIIRTLAVERLSLFVPVIASFLLFDEKPSPLEITAVVLGLAAVLCSFPWQKNNRAARKVQTRAWFYLALIFVGTGIVEVLLKQMAAFNGVSYAASLFMVYIAAFLLSLIGLFYLFAVKRSKFSWPHILFGWILGAANFGNVLFYIKAHRMLSSKPSSVLSAMNIGVILFGTFIGLLLFKEKLSNLNRLGIGLAIIAIIVISYA